MSNGDHKIRCMSHGRAVYLQRGGTEVRHLIDNEPCDSPEFTVTEVVSRGYATGVLITEGLTARTVS